MKLQKIILCIVAALTAFGVSYGLFEIGSYLTAKPVTKDVATETIQPAKSEKVVLPDVLPPEVTVFPPRPEAAPVNVTETENESEDETDYDEYIGGNYYIIGDLPKGFKDFESLVVLTTDYSLASAEKGYQEIHIPPKGHVYVNDKEFNFKRVSVSRKRLSFETDAIKGISYKFSGKYVDETVDVGQYLARAELEGVLTKLRDGKKIAEIKVKFEAGGC